MKIASDKLILAATDLSHFLSCHHLVSLDLRAVRGEATRPVHDDPVLEELRARGLRHETAYLKHLQAQGLNIQVAEQSGASGETAGVDRDATRAAMRAGIDVVYQATLADYDWSGRVDFLRRVDRPSALGAWSYEVIDTKLARETRAETILQLCVYSRLLYTLQGVWPVFMHVVIPGNGFAPLSYRVDDYAAYFRLLERGIREFIANPGDTYPELVSHCDYCVWWAQCEQHRRRDDHLCYVAGISRTQIKTLGDVGVERLADLAALDPVPKPRQGSLETLIRVREQARVQHVARQYGEPYFELKEPYDAEHGLSLLPEPDPDDIFLDLEGDHFVEDGVREYLVGYVTRVPEGGMTYTPLWATTVADERWAFEQFIDLATAIRKRSPGAHIYHFAPYEPAAMKRLMGRYATREVELDELLRGHAFVDLHTVVKRALIAGVERYSIKDLEPLFGYVRKQDLRAATQSRRVIENAIATRDVDETLDPHRRAVEAYNREDCESTVRLRDWLEELRNDLVVSGIELPRPDLVTGEASEAVSDLDRELQELRDGLLEGVPVDPAERSLDEQARFALAHMMEFHRREDKASWWEYFRLLDLDESELDDERRAVTGLQHLETLDPTAAPLERYHFPTQELDARSGDDAHGVDGTKVGKVEAIDFAGHTIDIKKTKKTAHVHPQAVVLHSRVSSRALRESLMRLGKAVRAEDFDLGTPYRAAVELLLRRPPAVAQGVALKLPVENAVEAACRIGLALDGNVLAVQGPPGTGKTYAGAQMVCALVGAGLKVGVTAVSHKVIVNLLEAAARHAGDAGLPMSLVHRQKGDYEGPWGITRTYDYRDIRGELAAGMINVLGATAWCWARPDFEQSVDVLIVDEAGQMSLANVLSCAAAGRSLVLLGDPQQLEQPLQSSHPEGSEASALYHLLDGADTMPAEKGLFLDETYRLHPDIAAFTSEIYYEGKVAARPGLDRQAILPRGNADVPLAGTGLVYVPASHTGNQARAQEEVEVISGLVYTLVTQCDWRDKDGEVRPLTVNDVLVVAPYNAQVSALIESMPPLSERIGTVDRFQGQEAPVVIYSMTSSTPEDAPRGMEFLYNSYRFNVATSRARALCILVGSPALFEPVCRTPRQMKMANGLCRYRELSRTLPDL